MALEKLDRSRALRELERATCNHPLVLLKGAWGSGKSTLLELYAEHARARDPHLEVLEVSLQGTINAKAFCRAIARAMALTTRHESTAIAEALGARTGSLIMLDDCSGMSSECRALLSTWSREAPGVTFVCASQRRFGIDEHTVELTGLETSSSEDVLSPAAKLLKQFVGAGGVDATDFDHQELNDLARATDGNPLTLKICAALVGFLTPPAVRDALLQPTTRLSELSPDAQPLVAQFCELQWNQLSHEQRLLLLELAVPPHGTMLPPTQNVDPSTLGRVGHLAELAGRSLIEKRGPRITLPALVRLAILERDANETRSATQRWAVSLEANASAFHPALVQANSSAAHAWFASEEDNLEHLCNLALDGSVDFEVGERVCLALSDFRHKLTRPECRLPKAFAPRASSFETRVALYNALARAAGPLHEAELFTHATNELEKLAERAHGELRELALAGALARDTKHHNLAAAKRNAVLLEDASLPIAVEQSALFYLNSMDYERACRVCHKLKTAALGRSDEYFACMADIRLATALTLAHDLERAREALDRCMSYPDERYFAYPKQQARTLLGYVLLAEGRLKDARAVAEKARSFFRAHSPGHMYIATCENLCGDIAMVEGAYKRAQSVYQSALETTQRAAWRMVEGEAALRLAAARRALGSPAPDLLEHGLERLGESAHARSAYQAWLGFYERTSLSASELATLTSTSMEAQIAWLAFERFSGPEAPQRDATLRIARDGAWVELLDGTRKWFRKGSPMRNILQSLAEARRQEPGHVIDTKTLISYGWPDEKMAFKSAQGRLWVTIRRLRKLGLEDALEQVGPGYRFSPDTPLELASAEE